jgi:amphi-Trp domain-containing protein
MECAAITPRSRCCGVALETAALFRDSLRMAKQKDLEKSYANREVAKKLHRLADALEQGKSFAIQIAGKRIRIPADAKVEFEYERRGNTEEVEIELQWKTK